MFRWIQRELENQCGFKIYLGGLLTVAAPLERLPDGGTELIFRKHKRENCFQQHKMRADEL
jgi:hypothetical protein